MYYGCSDVVCTGCGVVLQWLFEMLPCSTVAVLLCCLDWFGWVLVLHFKGACVASVGWLQLRSA